MNKLVRNGRVAVIISINYGSGWFSEHGDERLLFDPVIATELADKEEGWTDRLRTYLISEYLDNKSPEEASNYDYVIARMAMNPTSYGVRWVDQGVFFRIEEYDGRESILSNDEYDWVEA